jgi:hypothetical protein
MARELRNVPASIHARLLRIAHDRGEEYQRLLVLYALERFLYRLGRSEHSERYVLKGAMLFRVWEGALPRATRDLDLLGLGIGSQGSVLETLRQVWRIDEPDDGLELESSSLTVEAIRGQVIHAGWRARCRVRLGAAVIPLQIDVGMGDAVYPPAQLIEYPTLLDLPPPRVLAYPKEAVVAEKLHAMVELGLLNSRLKDYFDLDHLARRQAFDGRTLQQAIRSTFERRGTAIPGDRIEALGRAFVEDSMKQAQWSAFLRRVGLGSLELKEVVVRARALAEPPMLAAARGQHFDADWAQGGPWRQRASRPTGTR